MVLGSSWGSGQAVTPMRSPGREACVWKASQGRREVGLPWERRHRDGGRSDFRDDRVRDLPHLGRIVDEDAGNVTLSGPGRPFSRPISRAENALRVLGALWGGKYTQRVSRCCTTREEVRSSHGLCDDVGRPYRIRPAPDALPCRSRRPSSILFIPATLGTATACPGCGVTKVTGGAGVVASVVPHTLRACAGIRSDSTL